MTRKPHKKLHKQLAHAYAELHAQGAFKGDTWVQHGAALAAFLGPANPRDLVLDYGCGPAGGLRALASTLGWRVYPYDPYVAAYAEAPWDAAFTAFFSCDVFEHLPLDLVVALGRQVAARAAVRKLFVTVATRPANKVLSNGLNAHLIVQPATWWDGLFRGMFGHAFDAVTATADLANGAAVFAYTRKE